MSRVGEFLCGIVLAIAALSNAQTLNLDLAENETTFSGYGAARLPDTSLFRDPMNNAIGLACAGRATLAGMKKLGIADLDQRIETLRGADDIRIEDGRCALTFPVITGAQRRQLQSIVQPKARALAPEVDRITQRIAAAVPDRPELQFHLLWSRVMDAAWEEAWRKAFHSEGPRDATWVVYPPQPFDVGTNDGSIPGGGSYALTWAPPFRSHIGEVSHSFVDLFRVAWGKSVPPADLARLRQFGWVDSQSKIRAFAFHAGDPIDKLLTQLTSEYAALAEGAYAYQTIGKQFDVPAGTMFLILLHETAYAIFEELRRGGKLEFPQILVGGGAIDQSVRLVSLRLGDPPRADDDAIYSFVKTGWRGNAETAAEFQHVVDADPGNLRAWLFLGFSLYEVRDYRAAIKAFEQLTQHSGSDLRMRDWGRVWAAHMYDLLGERERAIQLYRVVAESNDSETMMFGQYDIASVAARDWAKQRLGTPFSRR